MHKKYAAQNNIIDLGKRGNYEPGYRISIKLYLRRTLQLFYRYSALKLMALLLKL